VSKSPFLEPETSEIFQAYAKEIAEKMGCERYQLDFYWWNASAH